MNEVQFEFKTLNSPQTGVKSSHWPKMYKGMKWPAVPGDLQAVWGGSVSACERELGVEPTRKLRPEPTDVVWCTVRQSERQKWCHLHQHGWMDAEIIIPSEVKSERQNKCDVTYMWNPKKKKRYKWVYLQNRNRITDKEYKLTITKGEGGRIKG